MKIAIASFLFVFLALSTKVKLTIDETIVMDSTDYQRFDEVLFELPIAASPTR